jgi:cytochrome c556
MAYRTAVLAEIILAKAPAKKEGDKDPKDWKEYAGEMSKSAQELGKAITAQELADLKKAAFNVNAACANCHGKFRD